MGNSPYSSNLSALDFYLFPKFKESLCGIHFESLDELSLAMIWEIRYHNKEQLLNGIQMLPDCWQTYIERGGNYIKRPYILFHIIVNTFWIRTAYALFLGQPLYLKIFPVKFEGSFKKFCGITRKSFKEIWRKSKKILMQFCRLEICTKFIEKQCTFFVQPVDRSNFEEL